MSTSTTLTLEVVRQPSLRYRCDVLTCLHLFEISLVTGVTTVSASTTRETSTAGLGLTSPSSVGRGQSSRVTGEEMNVLSRPCTAPLGFSCPVSPEWWGPCWGLTWGRAGQASCCSTTQTRWSGSSPSSSTVGKWRTTTLWIMSVTTRVSK